MQTYSYMITINEGNDEWWEELNQMSDEQRVEQIRLALEDELYAYDLVIVSTTAVQGELNFQQ